MPRIENSFFMRFKMAIRGQRPTATIVKLARGNPGKRRIRDDEPIASGRPVKPPKLRGRAAKLWDEVVEFAFWLAAADSYKLHIWCELQAEFEQDSGRMLSSRIAQLRAVGSELGLDPAARARLKTGPTNDKKDPAAEFLD
jgi:phage terminase small subunit